MIESLWVLRNAQGTLCPSYTYRTEAEANAKRDALNARTATATSHQPFTVSHFTLKEL